ncbi:lysophospholipid acyltransferase family protein [Pseudomonadota bacterium]
MLFIRSLLFSLFFIILTSLTVILLSPFLVFRNHKVGDFVGCLWSATIVWILKVTVKIRYEIRGMDNLPRSTNFIIACKHESMWETIIMHTIFGNPVFILKRQLTWIPFFGWHLRNTSHISVNRGGAAQALRSTIKQAKVYLKKKRNIVIFPQGTRVEPDAKTEEYPYKPGIAGIFAATQYPVVPAALNSGFFWGKRRFIKRPGTIILEFMRPINYSKNFDKKIFMKKLKNKIETKSAELFEEANREWVDKY